MAIILLDYHFLPLLVNDILIRRVNRPEIYGGHHTYRCKLSKFLNVNRTLRPGHRVYISKNQNRPLGAV